ncbi:protein phosphatase [Psychromicrobium silvestre]|uniref:Protein phosphatase n=1 Tax=Psychromicrobium silvestre TaxID=1645614 RepID=A0A7Y9LVL4_9MICC|nr:metallophosphoesterase family protein [Psychromicrobium silvestre]NYE96407.1 protein phosphatase [Psychromicrobium silvestre]
MERIALISDLHGNVTAFQAVLEDLAKRGIETIYNLGDVAGKGPRGSECVRLSQIHCTQTIRGNWDDFLPREEDPERNEAGWWWHRELTDSDRRWLLELPLVHTLELSGRTIRLVHASSESVYTRVHFAHTPQEFEAMFATTEMTGSSPTPSVVCYGDIHDAYLEVHQGRTLLNVGSVGNPLDEPVPCYVILEGTPGGTLADSFSVQFVRVPYDTEKEIAIATALGMPDLEAYAVELRTGIYRGQHAKLGLR